MSASEGASDLAERACAAAIAREHKKAEELYLLAAAKASASGAHHMLEAAKQWDKDAARQRRLQAIAEAKP